LAEQIGAKKSGFLAITFPEIISAARPGSFLPERAGVAQRTQELKIVPSGSYG
jgi:hypothetical protein